MSNSKGHDLPDGSVIAAPTPTQRQAARMLCAEHAYDTADLLDLLQLLGLDGDRGR